MSKRYLLMIYLIIIILLTQTISALCEEGQTDINTASAEELDELWGIGAVKARAIIDNRPFESLDELTNVSGIGEITLNNIKTQGLACVDNVEKDDESNEEKNETSVDSNEIISKNDVNTEQNQSEESKERETIILNPQVIKTNENKEEISRNYALYGFIAFCILIGILFLLKNKRYKNEFA